MNTKMAGARIEAALWDKFAANAKATGKSVAEALEVALRHSLAQGGRLTAAAGRFESVISSPTQGTPDASVRWSIPWAATTRG